MPSTGPGPADAPVDPDVDLHDPEQQGKSSWDPAVLAVIAAGGVVGAEARYGLSVWLPADSGTWPAATWWTNVGGSLLLGALMVLVTARRPGSRLLRPFLGVGVLGGFTTFSTAMVEVHQLVVAERAVVAMAYLLGSAAAALLAVTVGALVTRAAVRRWHRRNPEPR